MNLYRPNQAAPCPVPAHFALKQGETLAQGYRDKLATLRPEYRRSLPISNCPQAPQNQPDLRPWRVAPPGDRRPPGGRDPLAIQDMALGALRAKGVKVPGRRTMTVTRVRLREVFAKLQDRGVAPTVGIGRATQRGLVSSGPHLRHYVHGSVQPTEPTSGLIQIVR